jgi:DNA-binding transcriptional MerR regulator
MGRHGCVLKRTCGDWKPYSHYKVKQLHAQWLATKQHTMKIKQAAQALGLSVEAIRYFEREGLAVEPNRLDNGYRHYGEAQLARLRFIANCRALEMSHGEIRALLQASMHPNEPCTNVDHIVRTHAAHVAERIQTLDALHQQLTHMLALCDGDGALDSCAVVNALSVPELGKLTRQGQKNHL